MSCYSIGGIKNKCLPVRIKSPASIKPIIRKRITVIIKDLQSGISNKRVCAVSGCSVINSYKQIIIMQWAQVNAPLYTTKSAKTISTNLYPPEGAGLPLCESMSN